MAENPPTETFTVIDGDGVAVAVDQYLPDAAPTGVIHLMHGRAEHAGRYRRLAAALTGAGWAVYVDDHRGHGRTGIDAGGLGDLGPGGNDGAIWSVQDVRRWVADRHPDLALVLLGHSWGSFLLSAVLPRWSDGLAAAVLTGTTDRSAPRTAPRERPPADAPARERYAWLSRDQAEVDAYIADPWCGFERVPNVVPAEPVPGRPLPEPLGILPTVPLLIMNGGDDPIGGGPGGEALAQRHREAGLDVTLKIYDGGRHELFNETNRDEVTADLLAWLAKRR